MGESPFGEESLIEKEKKETGTSGAEDRTESESGDNRENFLKAVDIFALNGMDVDIRTYSPLALAFLGDAVYFCHPRNRKFTGEAGIRIPCTTPGEPHWRSIFMRLHWRPSAAICFCRVRRRGSPRSSDRGSN